MREAYLLFKYSGLRDIHKSVFNTQWNILFRNSI